MPSGPLLTALSHEYMFHLNHLNGFQEVDYKIEGVSQQSQLCQLNSQVALTFGMAEVALTWQQLSSQASQLSLIRARLSESVSKLERSSNSLQKRSKIIKQRLKDCEEGIGRVNNASGQKTNE